MARRLRQGLLATASCHSPASSGLQTTRQPWSSHSNHHGDGAALASTRCPDRTSGAAPPRRRHDTLQLPLVQLPSSHAAQRVPQCGDAAAAMPPHAAMHGCTRDCREGKFCPPCAQVESNDLRSCLFVSRTSITNTVLCCCQQMKPRIKNEYRPFDCSRARATETPSQSQNIPMKSCPHSYLNMRMHILNS